MKFPSMPSGSPCTPEDDGMPHVEINMSGISLQFNGCTMHIPASAILKNSVVIKPGGGWGGDSLNRVQLELLASDVVLTDNAIKGVRVYP